MPNSNDEVVIWFNRFIDEYRIEYTKLGIDKAPNSKDFTSPCQIYIFRVRRGIYEQQLIFIWHQEIRPDKEIVVYGPFEDSDLLPELDVIAEIEPWSEHLRDTNLITPVYVTYADELAQCIRDVRNFFNTTPYENISAPQGLGYFGSIISERVWSQIYTGDISNEDSSALVKDVIQEIKQWNNQAVQNTQKSNQLIKEPEKMLLGKGACFYPTIFVGTKPKPTFSQKHFKGYYLPPEQVMKLSFSQFSMTINNKGIIAITCTDSEAIKIFNTIFGVYFLLKDKFFYAIRENELLIVYFDNKTLVQKSVGWRMDTKRNEDNMVDDLRRIETSIEEIREVFYKSAAIYQDKGLSETIQFFLESITDFNNSQYSQAFIMAWYVLEKEMFEQWKNLISDKKITGERKDKLHSTNNWTIYHAIETLNLTGKISDEEFKRVDKLRIKRNDFVHKGKPIDKEACEELLKFITQLLKEKVEKLHA